MYKFIKSATNKSNWYQTKNYEVAFWGRSNVGKSSLLNAISNNSKLARVSKSPGRTQLLNFFEDENQHVIVDLPGYGYAKMSKSAQEKMLLMIEEYLINRTNLYHLFVLIDSRHGITKIDHDILNFLSLNNINYSIIYTKADKLNQKEKNQLLKRIKKERNIYQNFEYCIISSEKKFGIDQLSINIETLLDRVNLKENLNED